MSPVSKYTDCPFDSTNQRGENEQYGEEDEMEHSSTYASTTSRIYPPLYINFEMNTPVNNDQRHQSYDEDSQVTDSKRNRNKILRVKQSNGYHFQYL